MTKREKNNNRESYEKTIFLIDKHRYGTSVGMKSITPSFTVTGETWRIVFIPGGGFIYRKERVLRLHERNYEGGRKERWRFKSVGVLVLRLRRYLEKSPKRECDTEKGNGSGYALSAASRFLTFVFDFFEKNSKQLQGTKNVPRLSWLKRKKLLGFFHLLSTFS